jgi:hypothetical protein
LSRQAMGSIWRSRRTTSMNGLREGKWSRAGGAGGQRQAVGGRCRRRKRACRRGRRRQDDGAWGAAAGKRTGAWGAAGGGGCGKLTVTTCRWGAQKRMWEPRKKSRRDCGRRNGVVRERCGWMCSGAKY